MSGSGVTITVNDPEITSALGQIVKQHITAEPVLHRIAQYLRASEEARFIAQVAPDGEQWQPLSPPYAAWKQRRGFPGGILTLYGRLRSQWTDDVENNVLLFGTSVQYARIHQFGGDIKHAPSSGMMLRALKGGGLISKKAASKKSRAGFAFQGYERGGYTQHVPPRPFFGLSSEDKSQILEICQQWMRGEK